MPGVDVMKGKVLPTGKLDINLLRTLIKCYQATDQTVLMGPQIGEDAAAIDMGEKALIVTTDPITFTTDEIGYYSVIVNANDIATTGATPKWYTVTILLPENLTTEDLVDYIFKQIYQACEKFGISIIGGHTEITYGLDRPILVGQMMGEVQKEAMIRTGGAKPGDLIMLSKGICIEGTSLIAREREGDLLSLGIPEDCVQRAKKFLFDPGISVVKEAHVAFHAGQVHSMHDPTEGGLADGLHELSMAAGVQIEIKKDFIPIYEESKILCDAFHLNPLGVIASGALLITASPPEAEKILKAAQEQGITLTKIGKVMASGSPSVTMVTSRGSEPVPYFERDEVVKIF
jgi:hydrogenase expression/formation protein HypE